MRGTIVTASDDRSRPWFEHYPPGMPTTLEPRFATMLEAWRYTADRAPDAACVHYFDTTLTVRQVDAMADALAAALADDGLGVGERVAVFLQNDPQWLIAMLACWKLAAIPVALNPMYKERELLYHLHDSGATALLCLENLYRDVAAAVVSDSHVRRVITTHPTDLAPDGGLPPAVIGQVGPKAPPDGTEDLAEILRSYTGTSPARLEVTADDVAILTYTSGTTGPAKGAMNLHGAMAYNAQVFADWFELDHTDVILGVAPLFHITGIVAHMALSVLTGASLVLFHRFDTTQALRLAERWRPTFTIGSITVYLAILNAPDRSDYDLSSLEKVASGGAPVSPAIVERFRAATGIQIHTVYGLTETTSPSHLTPLGSHPPVDDGTGALSVGLPVPGADVTVVDLETGEEVAPGEVGEITIAGPMVVPGYWQKPEESRAAIRDGRLYTGDVGFMDEDGWFFVVDRRKDQINAGGYKIWPREVEDVLYTHPAVREAAVVGVPDEYRGETVKAFVSLVAGEDITRDELIGYCRDRMAAYKYPRQVEILDELPKTPTGKFLRRDLRDRHPR